MAYKCILAPNHSSYSVADGVEVGRVQLAGGMGRYRRAIVGATSTVDVSWIVTGREYEYLRAFYKTAVAEGSRRFLVDLILDGPVAAEHEAMFLPDYGMPLRSKAGNVFTVSAQLEVLPLTRNEENDSLFIAAVEEFGFSGWENAADLLDLALVEMPT